MSGLANCVAAAWQPGIGDPNATGWLTVLAYLLCFALSAKVWLKLHGRGGRAFWGLVALLMLALAVNKQLDLQSALTASGRCLAQAQGWYDHRRIVQMAFVLGVLGLMFLALLMGLRALRGQLWRNGIALSGLMVLCSFVAVRAIGFHHMDALIGSHGFGVSTNYLFENVGLLLIALNALWILRRG